MKSRYRKMLLKLCTCRHDKFTVIPGFSTIDLEASKLQVQHGKHLYNLLTIIFTLILYIHILYGTAVTRQVKDPSSNSDDGH